MRLTRRELLAGALASAAAAACSGSDSDGDGAATSTTTSAGQEPATTTTSLPADGRFALGVASGDPDDASVALWTRLVGGVGADDVEVRYEVATDETFADVVAAGSALAPASFGHSVHVVADGLAAGTRYRYPFLTDDGMSPVGTTRTTPAAGDAAALRLAVACCQRYNDGYWAAHRDLAVADVDIVLFLGDFVYETVGTGARALPGIGAREAATELVGYRLRYEAARADPDLAAAAAAHPWVVTWDDHEVANDYAGRTVDADRRAAAYQAWWEHQPTRLPPPSEGAFDVHRTLQWGSTAAVHVLDGRQHRDETTMLGDVQREWLERAIAGATSAWTVLGSPVVFSPVEVLGRRNTDAWDGFPAERDAIAGALRAGAGRPLVLSGDVHVQVVLDTPGDTLIPELVCPSISSLVGGGLGAAAPALPSFAPNVRHAADRRGWLRVDLDAAGATARYREVVDATDPSSAVVDGPSFML